MIWIIYFWCYFALNSWCYYDTLIKTRPDRWDCLDFVLSSVTIAGFLGYVHSIPIAAETFWKLWLWLGFSWDVTYNFFLVRESNKTQNVGTDAMIGWAMMSVKYVAIFLYAFRSDGLWATGV